MINRRSEENQDSIRVLIAAIGLPTGNGTAGQAVMEGLVTAFEVEGIVVDYVGINVQGLSGMNFNLNKELIRDQNFMEIKAKSFRQGGWLKRILYASNQSYFYKLEDADIDEFRRVINGNRYRAAIFFESISFELSEYVNSQRVVFIQGDPCSSRMRFGLKRSNVKSQIVCLLAEIGEFCFLRKMSKQGTIALFGTEHARRLGKWLNTTVLDLRPWLTGRFGEQEREENKGKEHKVVYYFGGTLEGTASRVAIEVLCEEVLPLMQRIHGRHGYELRIVGKSNKSLMERIGSNTNVSFTGFVDSFPGELVKGDIFILVSEYWIGVRTRICDALGAGQICIVHESIYRNMPELRQCCAVLACHSLQRIEVVLKKAASLDKSERLFMRNEAIKHYEQYYDCRRQGSILELVGEKINEGRAGTNDDK